MLRALACLLAVVLVLPARGQQLTPQLRQDLQQELSRVPAQYGIKGVVAAARLPDGSVWTGAAGRSTDSPAVALRPDMLFAVASITKTFTMAVTMRLIERGLFGLDDSIGALLPSAARPPNVNPRVTVRQLLAHTDGLADYAAATPFWVTVWGTPGYLFPREQLLGLVGPPLAAPDSLYTYGNTGYLLLGLLIEQHTGKPLRQVFREEIWDPAGMAHSYMGAYDSIPATETLAHAWSVRNGRPQDLTLEPRRALLSGFFSAGGALARVEDIAVWGKTVFGATTLLAPASLATVLATTAQSIASGKESGLGCTKLSMGNQTGWGHLGNIPGALSIVAYEPRCDVSLAVLFNDDRAPNARRAVVEQLYNVVQRTLFPQLQWPWWEASRTQPLRFSPNPATGRTQLYYGLLPTAQTELQLWDATGRLVRQLWLVPGRATHDLPLADLNPGVYYGQVREVDGAAVRRTSGRLVIQ